MCCSYENYFRGIRGVMKLQGEFVESNTENLVDCAKDGDRDALTEILLQIKDRV